MATALLAPMPNTATTPANPVVFPLSINTNSQNSQQKRRNTLVSPPTVEPHGVYSHDVVVKSGWLNKRTSKTKVGKI